MYVAELGVWVGWANFFGSIGVFAGAVILCAVVGSSLCPARNMPWKRHSHRSTFSTKTGHRVGCDRPREKICSAWVP
jgi:hypothetical protein